MSKKEFLRINRKWLKSYKIKKKVSGKKDIIGQLKNVSECWKGDIWGG